MRSTMKRHFIKRSLKLTGKVCLITAVILFAGRTCVYAQGGPLPGEASGSSLSRTELEIWNSPSFQKQFAQSYIAETEIEPRITEEERETMLEIMELISADSMDKALAMLDKALKNDQAASAVFDFTKANIHFQREELDLAAPVYQSAVEKYPKFRRAWKNLGLIKVRQSQFADAIPALQKVIELGGSDSITYGLLGFAYSNEENFLSAESAYRMAILMDPETMDWQLGLARSLFKQARYAEAVALCGKLIEKNPDRTDLWLLQANAYIGLNQPMEAAEIYEMVDALGGSTGDSLNILGDIYINEELFDLAAESYAKAIDTEADGNLERAVRSAKILAARGAFDETKNMISKIEDVYADEIANEDRKDLLKLRARLAVADGADDEEVKVLQEIVKIDPLDGEALILLGQHSKRQGDSEQAAFYFERASSVEGFEADAKVRHAQLLVSNGNYTDALPLLRRAQQVNYRENVQEYLEQVERVAKTR